MYAPRAAVPLTLALLAVAACGGRAGALRAADPSQAIEGAPAEARAEVGGVAIRARLDAWRGRPPDLEQRLTPVDVTIRNGSGQAIRVGPEAFTLVTEGGPHRVLDGAAVSRALLELTGFRRPPPPRAGAVGGPTFPGYDTPNPYGPGSASPRNSPVPPPDAWYPTQPASGTLASGDQTSILLYFDVPARTIRSAVFEVDVVGEQGERVGQLRLPFARG